MEILLARAHMTLDAIINKKIAQMEKQEESNLRFLAQRMACYLDAHIDEVARDAEINDIEYLVRILKYIKTKDFCQMITMFSWLRIERRVPEPEGLESLEREAKNNYRYSEDLQRLKQMKGNRDRSR